MGKLTLWLILAGLIILLLIVGDYFVFFGVSNKGSQANSLATSSGSESWHEIIRFQGTGIKNTETFTIPSNEWRISWDTSPLETYGSFNFQIYINREDGTLADVAANVIGANTDSSIMRGSGNYYLTINTPQHYTIVVEAKY